jgi:hypothetical protein
MHQPFPVQVTGFELIRSFPGPLKELQAKSTGEWQGRKVY